MDAMAAFVQRHGQAVILTPQAATQPADQMLAVLDTAEPVATNNLSTCPLSEDTATKLREVTYGALSSLHHALEETSFARSKRELAAFAHLCKVTENMQLPFLADAFDQALAETEKKISTMVSTTQGLLTQFRDWQYRDEELVNDLAACLKLMDDARCLADFLPRINADHKSLTHQLCQAVTEMREHVLKLALDFDKTTSVVLDRLMAVQNKMAQFLVPEDLQSYSSAVNKITQSLRRARDADMDKLANFRQWANGTPSGAATLPTFQDWENFNRTFRALGHGKRQLASHFPDTVHWFDQHGQELRSCLESMAETMARLDQTIFCSQTSTGAGSTDTIVTLQVLLTASQDIEHCVSSNQGSVPEQLLHQYSAVYKPRLEEHLAQLVATSNLLINKKDFAPVTGPIKTPCTLCCVTWNVI